MPVFASPCYKPQNARPGSGRRAKPLTSNLGSWGTTVRVPLGFEPVALPGGHLLPRCYQNARYQECPGVPEDIQLIRIALVGWAWVVLGVLSGQGGAPLNGPGGGVYRQAWPGWARDVPSGVIQSPSASRWSG